MKIDLTQLNEHSESETLELKESFDNKALESIGAFANTAGGTEYSAASSTQVKLYDDRLEIWNPGGLPAPLTPERLLQAHPSVPRNRLIANCLFYAGFIESWGSGTLRIAELARDAQLAIPDFTSTPAEFSIVLRKQVLTIPVLEQMGLSKRQVAAVLHTLKTGRITNRDYQDNWGVSKATASRELAELVTRGLLIRHGRTGQSTFYTAKR